MNGVLRKFYVGARKTIGERFKKTALQNIRYGLKRYLKQKRGIDILSDPDFHESNEVFKAVWTDLKRRGLGNIEHHPPISENDLKKQYSGKNLFLTLLHRMDYRKKYGSRLCFNYAEEDERTFVP